MNHRLPTTSRLMMKYIIDYYEANKKYPLNIQIAKHFVVSNPRVSYAMDSLDKKGYIKRNKSKIVGVGEQAENFVKGLVH